MGRLRTCRTAIAVVTPNSISRPWLYYETAIVDGRERTVIPCAARGLRFDDLRPPLGLRHGRDLARRDETEQLFRDVRFELGLPAIDDAPRVTETTSQARRPALAEISREAYRVCELLSPRLTRADERDEPRIETDVFATENDIAMDCLLRVIGELESLGWVVADRPRIGPGGHLPRFFVPTTDFFVATEAAFGGPDPVRDAKALAAAAVSSGQPAMSIPVLADSLGWGIRRTNIALYEIVRHVKDSAKGERMGTYAYVHLNVTPALRAFPKDSAE